MSIGYEGGKVKGERYEKIRDRNRGREVVEGVIS